MSYWRAACESLIAELVKDLPDDATMADRKAALKGKGWPAHQNTSWGRKMWGRCCKEYLAKFGPVKKVTAFHRYSPITGQYEMVDLNALRREGGAA
ncbi:hypothetical protein ABI_08930 [Asticcacaulis biprosthecium C19]|uniref:Uncharacterized protein n=1 Tax=Asticcacaulis biprosthecium C19 TaxID=715226 RepID=F4QGC9_9CAUL|nr:hypothetical protein [Asticcacaulis biprosthecium]EGF92457.1 hypothetical protein ABI_08930 [Asticcacaulis biprosthecium C19]